MYKNLFKYFISHIIFILRITKNDALIVRIQYILYIFVYSLLFILNIKRRGNPALGRLLKIRSRNSYIIINNIKYRLVSFDNIITLNPDVERWIWKYLKPKKGDVFIDVGAHIGKYTLTIAKIVGSTGKVIAIEPHPENVMALIEGIKLNNFKNIIIFNIAAWSNDTKLPLFLSSLTSFHSLKYEYNKKYTYTIKAKALDNILEKINLDKIDWIKIDVEGAEYEVLLGLRKSLRKYKPKLLIETDISNRHKVFKLLKEMEYNVKTIPEQKGYLYCEPK